MLLKNRTAIIFTANTPHLAHANLMINSLRDKGKGNFQGDIWVISTGLSDRAKNYLDSVGIKYLVSSLNSLKEWEYWKQVGAAQPEYREFIKKNDEEKSLILAFEEYRNKRMSKLVILDWVKKFGSLYDFIMLGDNDLYFQKDIHNLFERVFDERGGKVYYWQEEKMIVPGGPIWLKNFHYSHLHDASSLNFGDNEINIGVIMGQPDNIYRVFNDVKKSFFDLNIELFTRYRWHDQDLVRLNRAKFPERYSLLQEGEVVHLCNGGEMVVEEKFPAEFYHRKTLQKPYIIHFAGGAWKNYSSIKDTYIVNPDVYFFEQEIGEKYDLIRKGSLRNLFDEVNPLYYTAQNKRTKNASRKEWIELSSNEKKKLIFIGWLETKTHKSTLNAIPDFFNNELYDIAILNGNVTEQDESYLCEEFPVILAQLTRIIKDAYLIRTYGMQLPNVPEWIFLDTIKSAMVEYQCTIREARALANLLYLYFSDALDYYRPDLVCLWGFLSPWGKMIQNLCKWKKIPICSLEWAILPGTVAFDFGGHMAESWVSQHSRYFNRLSLDSEDIDRAVSYLQIANKPELSRNIPQEIDEVACRKVKALRDEKKKIILYMESNSAHSGNTLSDEKRARTHSPFYSDDAEAYQDLLKICKKHREWHILYKPHPISITRGIRTDIDEQCTTILYKGGLTEALLLADVAVTILSQGAYVSLINNVPVLLLGRLQLNDSGAAYVLDKRSDLEKTVEYIMEYGYTSEQKKLFVEHMARALKYYVFKADDMVEARNSYELGKNIIDIIENNYPQFYEHERQSYCRQLKKISGIEEIDEPMVSVIIPVYNAEEYLASCINSICMQTLSSLEIICINNGSTDNSQAILEYLASHDSRIIIHYQEEANQRLARNWGYDHAKGKYVYLMDSDDYLDNVALEKLVNAAECKQADLLYFFFREVRTDFDRVYPRPRWYSYKRFLPEEKLFKLERNDYKFFLQYPFPWAKLIRRDLVLNKALYFDNDCSNFDDNPHNLRTLLSAENVYVYNEQFYNFRIHNKSMTQSKNSRIIGMIDAVRIMNEIYQKNCCYDFFAKWYVPYKVSILGWAWEHVPDELKESYFNSVKTLFLPGDERCLQDEFVWSYCEVPNSQYLEIINKMLSQDYEEFVKEEILNKKNKEEMWEIAPWEQISKLHLGAIKICEKLHIINLAIKIKHAFVK